MRSYPGADAFVSCTGVTKKDAVFILADNRACRKAIGIIADRYRDVSRRVEVDYALPLKIADEIPFKFHKKLRQANIIILAASQSWYHAPFRKELKDKFKKRVVESYGLDTNLLKKGALCVNYDLIKRINAELIKILTGKRQIHIVTRKGTDFTARLKSLKEESGIYNKPGLGGNLPAGEISIAVLDRTARGRIVFDMSLDTFGTLGRKTIELKINDGRIVEASGDFSKELNRLFEKDIRLRKIAEIGIGTNPFSIIGRRIIEDEKKIGTVHIGFGNDVYFGGKTSGPHYDGVLGIPTVEVDTMKIIYKGKPSKHLFSKELSRRLNKFGVLD